MKIVTAHIKINRILLFLIIILVSAVVLISFLPKNREKDTEKTTEKIKQTTSENITQKAKSEMKDKNGNPYSPSGKMTVYLTFDDGPSKNTPEILRILENYGIGATFFVINGKYNGYMKMIADSKSVLALHSYSHKYSEIYSSKQAFLDDLYKIRKLVFDETGIDTKIIRFPGGTSNTVSRKYRKGIMTDLVNEMQKKGYVYFDWNCDNGDAYGKETTAEEQYKKATAYPKNTDSIVILMHDIDICGVNIQALCKIIDFYQDQGADFGVITENSARVCHKVNN